jgi:hypothetical protein
MFRLGSHFSVQRRINIFDAFANTIVLADYFVTILKNGFIDWMSLFYASPRLVSAKFFAASWFVTCGVLVYTAIIGGKRSRIYVCRHVQEEMVFE